MGRIVLVALALAAGALAQTPTGGLAGTVVDQAGGGVSGVKVAIAGLSSPTATTNEQGEFRLSELEPGEYQLSITAAGFVPKRVTARVEAKQTTALGEIRIIAQIMNCAPWIQPTPTVVIRKLENRRHGVLIVGTVRSTYNKSPVVRATVRLGIFAEPDAPEAVVKTDQNGGFEFTGLEPGTYVLSVESDLCDPVRIRQIVVREGFEVRIDDIVMGNREQICL